MFAHHVDNTMEKKLFLKKHNFNIKAYTLCVGLFFYKIELFMEEGILALCQIELMKQF